jgi:hypothetical protein
MKDYKTHAEYWLSPEGINCKEGDVCLIHGEKHKVASDDYCADVQFNLIHIED